MAGWRLIKARLAAYAFSVEGARLYGGRWSSPGTPVVYISETLALAALEVLVHVHSRGLPTSYVTCRIDFDSNWSDIVDPGSLPADWRSSPATAELRAIGDDWVRVRRSLLLKVPSAIVPQEHNYLINPFSSGFRQAQHRVPHAVHVRREAVRIQIARTF